MSTVYFDRLTLDSVQAVMLSAVAKHGEERTPRNPHMANGERLAILVEEVGEVAKCLTYDQGYDVDELTKELLQVAAMALAWVEAIDVIDEDDSGAEGEVVEPATESVAGVG